MLVSKQIRPLFAAQGIHHFAVLPFTECKPSNERLYKAACDRGVRSVIIYLCPYYWDGEERNISLYAVSEGYHLILGEVSSAIIASLRRSYPDAFFDSYADHSPILEVSACLSGGLGFFGQNGLLINPALGSYLFIGGIYTDLECEAHAAPAPQSCSGCGACKAACPVGLDKSRCLSFISQKKEITPEEAAFLRENHCIWGCDICQRVCPHNAGLERTPVAAFGRDRTPMLTLELLRGMSDEAFDRRGYSWRGRKTIERNLLNIQENKTNEV